MSNKDFFKKMVQVANPDAVVRYDPNKAAVGASKKPAVRMDDDRERLKFEMINRAYGVDTPEAPQTVLPQKIDERQQTKTLMKKMTRLANPKEAAMLDESHSIVDVTPQVQPSVGSLPLTELKETLKSYAEGLKQGIGGGYAFQTHPTLYGWSVTMSHYLNENEATPVVEVKASLNPDQMPSRIEVSLGVAEGKAIKLSVAREYSSVADMVEDFGDLAELVMKL